MYKPTKEKEKIRRREWRVRNGPEEYLLIRRSELLPTEAKEVVNPFLAEQYVNQWFPFNMWSMDGSSRLTMISILQTFETNAFSWSNWQSDELSKHLTQLIRWGNLVAIRTEATPRFSATIQRQEYRDNFSDAKPEENSEEEGYQWVLSAKFETPGGQPLAFEDVMVIDQDTKQQIGPILQTDADGKVVTTVPWEGLYDIKIVEDEEWQVYGKDEDSATNAYLIVQFVTPTLEPIAHETVRITGPDGTREVETDENGEVDILAELGSYELTIGDDSFVAHTVLLGERDHHAWMYQFVVEPEDDEDEPDWELAREHRFGFFEHDELWQKRKKYRNLRIFLMILPQNPRFSRVELHALSAVGKPAAMSTMAGMAVALSKVLPAGHSNELPKRLPVVLPLPLPLWRWPLIKVEQKLLIKPMNPNTMQEPSPYLPIFTHCTMVSILVAELQEKNVPRDLRKTVGQKAPILRQLRLSSLISGMKLIPKTCAVAIW
jgi:hypothetical protein